MFWGGGCAAIARLAGNWSVKEESAVSHFHQNIKERVMAVTPENHEEILYEFRAKLVSEESYYATQKEIHRLEADKKALRSAIKHHNETNMALQAEVENAKDNSDYWRNHFNELRNQFDEMQQRAEAAGRRVNELERDNAMLQSYNGDVKALYEQYADERDTEQQIKALDVIIDMYPSVTLKTSTAHDVINSVIKYSKQLRNKANNND